jgi:uncharacterized protein with PIN domain
VSEKVARTEDENGLICARCNAPLEKSETKFDYLGHKFTHNVPKCPVCGMVYVSEELACGRIAEVETMLEDK